MKKHFLRKTRTESAATDMQQSVTVSRHYGEIHKSNIRISGSKTASFFFTVVSACLFRCCKLIEDKL